MNHDTSLLERFEELPELRERILKGTARKRAGAQKKVANLLEHEPIIEDIIVVLDQQQRYRDELGITQDIRPITDARREDYMANLAHIIPFFALRAFSLPADYRVPKENKWTREVYNAFIDAIVIQPEYLPDDLLVSLGLMSESEKKSLSLSEKISKKIELISQIKQLLKVLAPLKIGEKRTTGRISRVADPQSPHFGGYMVFQELTEIENNPDAQRRNMRRRIVPRFFKDHYSLIRSQRYAAAKLQQRVGNLRGLRDDIMNGMLIKWQRPGYSLLEKKQDIETVKTELKGQLTYHEKRAFQDRIMKIGFENPEHDRQRLIGACNDIIKAIEQKIGKNNEISAQTEWLKDSERQVRSSFEFFYEELMLQIPELNQTLQGVNPQKMTPDENLKGNQTHTFNLFLRNIQRFQERIGSLPLVGNPFHTLPGLVENYQKSMADHRKERKGAIGKAGIRLTLGFLLELKKIRFEVMVKEAEYRQKVRGSGMNEREKSNLVHKIGRVRDSLENVRFLPDIELKEGGQRIFQEMIGILDQISRSIGENSSL